jgi:hypothetical protein
MFVVHFKKDNFSKQSDAFAKRSVLANSGFVRRAERGSEGSTSFVYLHIYRRSIVCIYRRSIVCM